MGYVKPSGQVHIFNCTLTSDYNHTFWFDSEYAQANYFSNAFLGVHLTEQSYQRVTSGKMKVSVPIAEMQQYNYMCWIDPDHGNKWYYAFITNYEYVNEHTTELAYQIDVLQTYMFDWQLMQCFIERQHAETDEIGDNLQPEPVEPGEMLPEKPALLQDATSYYVIVSVGAQNSTSQYNQYNARTYDYVATGSTLVAFIPSDVNTLRNFLTQGSDGAWNSVVSSINGLYTVPTFLIPGLVPSGGLALANGLVSQTITKRIDKPTKDSGFGSYMPRNNKLYTYPYTYADVTNNAGTSMPLRYEFFRTSDMGFTIYGTILRPVQLVCKPLDYGAYKEANEGVESVVDGLSINNFPQGQWNSGGYSEWQAQNAIPLALNTVTSVVGSVVTGKVSKAVTGSIGAVVDAVTQEYRASYNQPSVRGTLNSGGANVTHRVQNFYISRMRCHSQRAKVIDDFFTMFGYAQNKIGVPNIHARRICTYVKTQNMCLIGNIPDDYKKVICDCFNNGVTFWASPRNIMRYDLDNPPLGDE